MHSTHRRPWLAVALGAALFLGLPAFGQDADTDLDKGLQELEVLIDQLKDDPRADPVLLRKLESIAGRLRAAKGADATPAAPGGAPAPGDDNTYDNLPGFVKDGLFRDVELQDGERAIADGLLRQFYADYSLARNNDDDSSKRLIMDDTKGRIDEGLSKKAAGTLKTNLERAVGRWERWGGGGR